MCNQTEMWLEISDYDRRAAKGLVHTRGIAHNPATCLKCKADRALEARLKSSPKISPKG